MSFSKEAPTIPRKELQLDSNLLVDLLKNVKRLQITSSIIFSAAKADTSNTQELVDKLQIILENQATKNDPFSIFSVANDTDVFTSTLFPAAMRTTEQLIQIFNWGEKSQVMDESPRLVSLRLCTFPQVIKSIILIMSSLLMVYRSIGHAYSAHNAKLRVQLQKSHKADVNIEDLARQTVFIDKTFQTAFMPTVRTLKSKMAPLVPLYSKLAEYVLTNMHPESNKRLQRTQEMFSEAARQLEQFSKGVPARVVKKALDPDDLTSSTDPKLTSADNFISALTSSDVVDRDPFRSILPALVNPARGRDNEDVHDRFNAEMMEAAGHATYIVDFFDKLQNNDDFMCSAGRDSMDYDESEDEQEDEQEEDDEEDDEDENKTASGGNKRRRTNNSDSSSSSSSSESSSSSSDDDDHVNKKTRNKKKPKYSLSCKLVKDKTNSNEKPVPDVWKVDDEESGMFGEAGRDTTTKDHVQDVLEALAKEVSENLDKMNKSEVPASVMAQYIRKAYKSLNDVVRIINESLVTTEKTFETDLLRRQLMNYTNSLGVSLFENDGCEDDDYYDEDYKSCSVPPVENMQRRAASLFVTKLPMIVFLKENIEQSLEVIKRETAEYALLESKIIVRSIVTDAAAQRIYDAMTGEPRCLIQLAVPVSAIPIIYQLNINHNISDLYNSITDALVEGRVLLQLNSLMIVPIEYYMFSLVGGQFFDNSGMLERYKYTHKEVMAKMFEYAVTFAGIMYRQQVEASGVSTGMSSAIATTNNARAPEKMMLKSTRESNSTGSRNNMPGSSILTGTLGTKKFDFIRNTNLVEKELAAHPKNYIECLSAFTTGLNGSTNIPRTTGDSASIFMLTNFIYSLDIVIILNLIGVQLGIVDNPDRVIELVYSHLDNMIKETGNEDDAETVAKMLEIPIVRLLSTLIVLNPRNSPGNPDLKVSDGRLYDILAQLVAQKPKFVRLLEQMYNTTISAPGTGEISVAFALSKTSASTTETEEYTIRNEFFEKFQGENFPNLLEYIDVASVKRGETIGEVETAQEYASIASTKIAPTVIDHLLPKFALLGAFDWLSYMVRMTAVAPTANNMAIQLTPTTFKTKTHTFKITM